MTPTLTADQLECLASPIRREVFTTLRGLGTASARELAEELHRTPEILHYHLKALHRAGLIRECGRRATARKPECLYEPAERSYRLPDLVKQPELAAITRKAVAAGLRQTTRGYEAAAIAAVDNAEVREHISVIQAGVTLRPENAAKFIALIEEANRFARQAESKEGLRLHWCSVVFPETPRSSH
jgi:hypothetical protein